MPKKGKNIDMKNLVLGMLCNYEFYEIEPFFVSMRQYMNPENVDCIMLVSNISDFCRNQLISYNVSVIDTEYKTRDDIDCFRWAEFRCVLEKNKYDYVLLCDVRDVFFQKNIFDDLEEEKIHIALEDQTLTSQKLNASWFKTFIGNSEYEYYKEYPVICCGTILGKNDSIIEMLQKLDDIISNKCCLKRFGIAQSAFQYLVYSEGIKKFICDDIYNGNLYTASTTDKFYVRDDCIYTVNGVKPSVIHQYDRVRNMVEIAEKKYRSKEYNSQYYNADTLTLEESVYYGDFKKAIELFSKNRKIYQDIFSWTDIIILSILAKRYSDNREKAFFLKDIYLLLYEVRLRNCNAYYLEKIADLKNSISDLEPIEKERMQELFKRVEAFLVSDGQVDKADIICALL